MPTQHFRVRNRRQPRTAFVYFGLASVIAMGAASAQIASPPQGSGAASSVYERERAACLSGRTQQEQPACLREAINAAAEKRKGELGTESERQLMANAMQRCEVLVGEEQAACAARVLGYGQTAGSVAGGGVIREVETVVVPPGQNSVTIEPKTPNPVLIVPRQ